MSNAADAWAEFRRIVALLACVQPPIGHGPLESESERLVVGTARAIQGDRFILLNQAVAHLLRYRARLQFTVGTLHMTTETPAATAPKPTRIPPVVTTDAKFFWEGADREEFLGQKCSDCGVFRFPPRPMCPHCHSVKTLEVPLSGQGTVYSWIIPRHPAPYGFTEPPIVAVIALEEGFRFVSNVVGIAPEDVRSDMPVEVCFEPTMKDHKVPVFRPCSK